jgi:protein SCO1/2
MKTTYVFIGLLAFALGIGIAQYYLPHSEPALDTSGNGNTRVPVTPGKFGGDFTLKQDDQPVKLSDFRGKLIVMYFGYASCPDVCPTTLAIIASALRELTPKELEKVQPIFISVDPQRDQGENLAAYASHFHPSFIGITGYLVDHTSKTYMVSQDGKYVTILPHDMIRDDVLNAIRSELQ